MLNLKIRKHFFNKNVSINLIGSFVDLSYPVNHLGNSVKTLLDILEGRHSFCKAIRKAKNPLIIIGSAFTLRIDAQMIQNMLRIFAQKAYLLLNNKYNINFVHSNLAQAHYCELGLNSNPKSNINQLNNSSSNIAYIFNNNNEINEKINTKNTFCSLNTHRIDNDNKFQHLLPINSFYERNSLNVNIEGTVQKAFKSKSTLNLSRNSEDILRGIVSSDLNFKKNKFKFFTKK
jgi:NADH-quinone oxidoreductase subunit G